MARVLITGTSGFIGRAAAQALRARHDVVCLSRKDDELGLPRIAGSFHDEQTLQKLAKEKFDALVHLGAVTGGCTEEEGITINVAGTRRLMRVLLDAGCRKFVMASSTAVVGFRDPAFEPVSLPIDDEHPCLDKFGYGFSKYLMEEVTRYHCRQCPDGDFINLRYAAIFDETAPPALVMPGPVHPWAFASITQMSRRDAVRCLKLALEQEGRSGVRVLNATAPKAWAGAPVPEIIRAWLPNTSLDFSHYNKAGAEKDAVYSVLRIRRELGFVAEDLPERMRRAG